LRSIFRELDKNNDGELTIDELKEGFLEHYGDQLVFEGEIEDILKQVDSNNNGVVEYSEFITACTNLSNMITEKNLKEAFDLFDMDNNGEITPRELKHILGPGDTSINDEEWENLIIEFD
jgi:calcium-dependent protein kinase